MYNSTSTIQIIPSSLLTWEITEKSELALIEGRITLKPDFFRLILPCERPASSACGVLRHRVAKTTVYLSHLRDACAVQRIFANSFGTFPFLMNRTFRKNTFGAHLPNASLFFRDFRRNGLATIFHCYECSFISAYIYMLGDYPSFLLRCLCIGASYEREETLSQK